MLRTALCLCALLCAAPAWARAIDAGAIAARSKSAELRTGFKQYDDLEFESALRSFEAAIQSGALSNEETAAAALFAGIISQSLNDRVHAKGYFQQAVTAMPELEPPDDAPPKTKLAFNEAKRAVNAV